MTIRTVINRTLKMIGDDFQDCNNIFKNADWLCFTDASETHDAKVLQPSATVLKQSAKKKN